MDKTQRMIVVLLIVAILFSVGSVFVSLFASNIISQNEVQQQSQEVLGGNNAGGVGLVVESSNVDGGSGR